MGRQTLYRILMVGVFTVMGTAPGAADDAALGPIHQLEKMNIQIHQMKSVPESVTEDYLTLVQTVANLHDPRAVPALLGAIVTGDLAMQGLASLGDAALLPVITATKENEVDRVYAALQTLNLMLDPNNLRHFKNAEAVKEKIRQTLLPLQDSQDPILVSDVQEIIGKLDQVSPLRIVPPEPDKNLKN